MPRGTQAEYVPGMCSELSPHKDLSTLPPMPPLFTLYFVQELANRTGNRAIASLCAATTRNAPFAFLRAIAARDDCYRAVRSEDLSEVADHAVAFAIEMEKSSRRNELPVYAPDPELLTAELTERVMTTVARPALWAAMLRAKVLGHDATELIGQWRSRINSQNRVLSDELTLVAQFATKSAAELGRALRDHALPAEKRMWAGVFLIGNEDASLLDTVYAHTILVRNAKDYKVLWDVGGPSVDDLIRKDWQRFCNAAFLLRNPRLHVDAIRSACEAQATGWPSAALILLAAIPATDLRLAGDIIELMRQIASEVEQEDQGNKDLLA